MEYHFRDIEKKWQARWAEKKTFAAKNGSDKPKYYVLDMFPYPSGAGLHVGHPLGYIASDIVARYKRHNGFNVLHPMGYDSFGLPAEQYAIQTGQHPAITTEQNINRYREQLDKIGFSFDWDREVRTSDPDYYKWTQWIFIQLFHAWYNPRNNKTEHVDTLINIFETEGFNAEQNNILTGDVEHEIKSFSAGDWKKFDEEKKNAILMNFRIAYLGEAYVNWCPALGTVLANDEVKDGVSERGGYPVERKLMKQWSMRITAYAQRLLDGLDKIEWSDSLKEAQRYWIGRSEGSSLKFQVASHKLQVASLKSQTDNLQIEVFTTRPDTVFGVSFLTLAPEHEYVDSLTTAEQKAEVEAYVSAAKNRSERERQADVRKVTGVFTGSYAIHPFTGKQIPIWIGDYVLVGYGTGAVMGVPAHDSRDHAFAKHFNLPIQQVIEIPEGWDIQNESYDSKDSKVIHSDFISELPVKEAIKKIIAEIEKRELGKGKINFRLRDAVFGRQRYWGEPIPVYYKNGIPYTLPESELPLVLPEVDKFLPTETGEPPLARAQNWKYKNEFEYEYTTMPGWAGSSWYYLRYMDAQNNKEFVSKAAADYWKDVDLYIGGSEHATGHLMYVRFWTMALKDLGFINIDEPMFKLINQGMIQGESAFLGMFVRNTHSSSTVSELFNANNLPRIFFSKVVYEKFEDGTLDEKIKEEIDNKRKEINLEIQKTHPDSTIVFDLTTTSPHIPVNYLDKSGKLYKSSFEKLIKEDNKFEGIDPEKDVIWEEDETGKYLTPIRAVEKMSKSKYNVVTPDEICEDYGADTLRMYEMFLGPLELSKPWSTNGITGVHNFLRKLWRLFYAGGNFNVREEEPTKAELKTLHKTIKKITEEIERYAFNTSVSNFMICVNELTDLKCNKRKVLEPVLILLSPYAPHITEELWEKLGHTDSIAYAAWPKFNEEYLKENSFNYPVSFNGKTRLQIELPIGMSAQEIEKEVMSREEVKKYLNGGSPKKVIVVPNRIVNIVL